MGCRTHGMRCEAHSSSSGCGTTGVERLVRWDVPNGVEGGAWWVNRCDGSRQAHSICFTANLCFRLRLGQRGTTVTVLAYFDSDVGRIIGPPHDEVFGGVSGLSDARLWMYR
jgi:hypothetical protein